MKIKNVILSVVIASVILILNPYTGGAKAADISQTVKNFSPKTNAALNKMWTVKFSSEVDEKTIGDNIKVVDKASGNFVNVTVKLSTDKKSVQIDAPLNGYGVNKNYSVLIGSKVANLSGKTLSQGAELDFTTASIKSVDNINDVNTTVGTMPKLPGSINATLTDGTTKVFDISWDNLSQSDISKAGTVVLNGTLKDTDYKVSINIIIDDANTAFLKQFSIDLENVEAKISNSNERNVVIALKTAVDAKIANPSYDFNSQPIKDAYYALTDEEKSDLQGIIFDNFSLDELLQIKELL